MAERIYTIKSGLKPEPMAAPAQPASVGAAGGVGDVASYNANIAGVPTANVAEVASAGQTAGRVYRKKSNLTAGTNIPTATSQRTYTPKLSVRVEQAKNLQGMWDWLDEANQVVQSTIEYTKANDGKWVDGYASEYSEQVNRLLQNVDKLTPYIEFYKEDEEAYKNLTEAFTEFKSYLTDFSEYASGLRDYYGQYGSEADYNKAVEASKKWQEDAAQLEQDVEMLAGKIQYTQDLIDLITAYDVEMSENGDVKLGKTGDGLNGGKLYDLEKKMDYYGIPYEVYDNGLKRQRYKEALEKELSDYKAEYNPAKQQQVVNAANTAKADPEYDTYVEEGKKKYEGRYDGYEDASQAMDADTKLATENLLNEVEKYDTLFEEALTREQQRNYYYLLGKYGFEEANAYFVVKRDLFKNAVAVDYYNKIKGTWKEKIYGAYATLDSRWQGVKNAFNITDTDDRVFDPQYVGAVVREEAGQVEKPIWYNFKDKKWETTINGNTRGQIWYDTTGTLTDVALQMAVGKLSNLVVPGSARIATTFATGLSTGGAAYKEALDAGYHPYEAVNKGFLQGGVEAGLTYVLDGSGALVGGSVVGKTLESVLGNMERPILRATLLLSGRVASESLEESLQEVLVPFIDNVTLDANNTWDDVDWDQAGYAALLAALTTLSTSGVGAVASKPIGYAQQINAYRSLGKTFLKGKEFESPDGEKMRATIDRAIEIGMDNAKGTDARIAAEKISEKVKAGKKVSAYSIGRMVAQSQTPQALVSKAIEAEVVRSGKAVGYDAEAVDTVARAAVVLNQRVRFATQGELRNKNNAAEYHPETGMVLLNPVLTNPDMLIGKMLAHEMTHAAEGTAQLQKLAKIAQRMEGKDGWESLKADVKSDYAKVGKQLSDTEVQKEALAHWIGENLFKNKAFAKAVVDGDVNLGNAFFYVIDRLRRAMGAKNASAGNLAMLERLFMQALDNRILGPREGDVQGAIVALKDGKIYVQADRKVLTGTDKEVWKGQIDTFFDNVLLQNGSLTVESVEGDELTITKDETVWKGKDEHLQIDGKKRDLTSGEYYVKLKALSHIDELAEASVVQRNKDGTPKIEPDKKNHPFAKDGFEYRTVYFQDFDGKYYRVTLSVGLADGIATVYNVGKIKEATAPDGDIISAIGSKARDAVTTDPSVTDVAPVVNTQSMQEGAGIFAEDGGNTAQGALLPPEYRPGARAEGVDPNANVEGDNPSVTADAVPPPFTQGRHAADAANGEDLSIDEAAVLREAMGERRTPDQAKQDRLLEQLRGGKKLTAKVRSQPQGKKQVAVDTSDIKTEADTIACLEMLDAELGTHELLKRMWNAAQAERPTGMVEIDGKRVDANDYMDAYELKLPKDKAALKRKIEELETKRSEEMVELQKEGELEHYHSGGLKIDLQLFAARRLWDLVQLEEGESGTEVRQFYEKRLKGTDAMHNQELIEMLATNEETYNPIGNKETLKHARDNLERDKYKRRLLNRITKYAPWDHFNAEEVAAAIELIRRAINDGELDVAADLIVGLSRKGTEAGRAVQAYSMMARMTPEGTLKAAVRTVRAEADTIICEGADEKLDALADDIVRAIKEAENKGVTADAIADRIRNGGFGQEPMTFHSLPPAFAAAVQEDTGTDVSQYKMLVEPSAMEQIINGGNTDMVRTIVDAENGTLRVVAQDGDATAPEWNAAKRLPRHLSREELVQMLSENLAAEKGNFFTQEEIYELLQKTVKETSNIPEQLRRYVLKGIRKDDGGLAQRIYELHKRGDLKQTKLRSAMEQALDLPHLTADDMTFIVQQTEKINSLQDKPVEQAEAMDELYDYLGAKLHVSKLEMWTAWRKFGMLFNFKTHARNFLSNFAYMCVRKADTAVATALERLIIRDPEKRAAALGWRYTKHGQSIMPELRKRAELAVLEMQKRGSKYEDAGTGMLKQHRDFYGKGWVGQALNGLSEWNSKQLEREDILFFRPAYIDALGQIMTARGATEITDEMHDIAMRRALEATFRADNAISDWFSTLKKMKGGVLVDVAVPFHRTPANIAEQAVWHSPVGLVKGFCEFCNATWGKGSKDVAQAINTFSKGVTGTALYVIGYLIGSAGWFNAGFGKSKKERDADEMEGLQSGSFIIFGVSVSLDWLQPAATPLIVGASLAERLNEEGLSGGQVFGAFLDGTDSLFELTMLQSVYDLLGGYEAGVSSSLLSLGENALTESTPTLLGQLARAIDPVQRKVKGDNAIETMINRVMARIPGLTFLLDPELDVWGNEVYRTGKASGGSAALNVAQQFVAPANIKIGTGKDDPVSQEILRLYNTLEEDSGDVIPTSIDREDVPEGEDWTELNKLLGGANRLAVEEFIQNERPYDIEVETGRLTEKGTHQTMTVTKYYRDMTDEERAKVLSNIYSNNKEEVLGKNEHLSDDLLNDGQRYARELIGRTKDGEKGNFTSMEAQDPTELGMWGNDVAVTGENDSITQEIWRLYNTLPENESNVLPSKITAAEAREMGEDWAEVQTLLGGANRLAVEELVNNKKAYAVEVETGKLTEKGNPQTKKVTKYYRDMTDDERRRVLKRIYTANEAEVKGNTEGKTDKQLTDSERYIRDLLRRVRSGERGTYDTVDEQAQQQTQQENTSYYEELLRRMRNGY